MFLPEKIETYLGRVVDFINEVELESKNHFDDNGEFTHFTEHVVKWNATDKPQPTKEQLESITEYINPYAESEIRSKRDQLITETDWTQLDDTSITQDTKAKYKEYRQALRDITKQAGFPHDVVFPEKPV